MSLNIEHASDEECPAKTERAGCVRYDPFHDDTQSNRHGQVAAELTGGGAA